MLATVAIVPGPPAFVVELMGSAAHELDELRLAADLVVSRAVSDLIAASGDSPPGSSSRSDSAQLVIVGPGEPGEFNGTGPVSFGGFGRDVVVPALAEGRRASQAEAQAEQAGLVEDVQGGGQGALGSADLPTPLMVARYLAGRDVATHPEHAKLWASARWVTTTGADAANLGEQLGKDGAAVALILVADGAICLGPKAPRAEDSRAPGYEDLVCEAYASGERERLAQVDANLGRELGATGPQLWPVLIAAADGAWRGELVWRGAPFGVGWAVAAWRRPQ